MAYTTLTLKNPHNGHIKQAPMGYSWTALLFGFALPAYRGDWKWAIITLALSVITSGIFNFVLLPFIYNKIYLKGLINKGFKVEFIEEDKKIKVSRALGMELPTTAS